MTTPHAYPVTTPAHLCFLLTATLLSACANGPVTAPIAAPAAPVAFKEAAGQWTTAAPADAHPRGPWWRSFDDPVLDDLVTRAGAGNTNLQIASARVKQAQALLRSTNAERMPQIGIGAGASRGTLAPGLGSFPGQALTELSAGATASWQADVFGKISKAVHAADLDEQASAALLQSTRLLVQSQVAQTYFSLRALDAERALVRDTVAAYRDTLQLTESRYKAGDVAELDFARVRTEVAETESQALSLDRRRAQTEHALAVLMGEVPSGFSLAEGTWTEALPRIPPGVPSEVLARRPDVSAAQRSLQAAEARVGVARTAWFPDLALTANAGYGSTDLSDLFKWSARAWGIGALLSLPLIDGGRRSAALQSANALWDSAAASYREQLLNAFREVEDQLSELRLLDDQARAQADAVDSAALATRLSTSRYKNGYVSQLELLDARRSELNNRRQALQVRSDQYQATIGLIRALGGGWGDEVEVKMPPTALAPATFTTKKHVDVNS